MSNYLNQTQIKLLNSLSPQLFPQHYHQIQSIKPQSIQVISRQATLNIGTIGHVAHGKSTLVKTITGINTIKTKQQLVNNITIRLGYANAKIYQCKKCPKPQCFSSKMSNSPDQLICQNCGQKSTLVKHVSFVDCPGHDKLLSTMLAGAAVMDAALLLISANSECPQPQTIQHLAALEILQLTKIIIVQNKIDLVFGEEGRAEQNYQQIKNFVKKTICQNSPVIPISAKQVLNIDAILQNIVNIPIPKRNLTIPPKLIILRSFDINKPGTHYENIKGGVIGGSLVQGILKVGMKIQIKPGIVIKDSKGNIKTFTLKSQIISLLTQQNNLLYALPGGLIGVGLKLDPSITKNDRLIGNTLGEIDTLPNCYLQISVEYKLMARLLNGKQKSVKIEKIKVSQILKFNIQSCQTPGKVIKISENIMKVILQRPISGFLNQKIVFSRRMQGRFRLIGWGFIRQGIQLTDD